MCALPLLLALAAILKVPESPYWLMLRGRKDVAVKALRWLRGPNCDISDEITNMEQKILTVGRNMEYGELWRPRTRKPFLIALFLMTMQQVCGSALLVVYTGTIFRTAGILNHNTAVVYTGLAQTTAIPVAIYLMDRAGRRPLILTSACVMDTSTVMLGYYYYTVSVDGESWPEWVAVVAVLVAIHGYGLGRHSIPWLASAELFNTTIRSTANAVCLFYNRNFNFVVTQVNLAKIVRLLLTVVLLCDKHHFELVFVHTVHSIKMSFAPLGCSGAIMSWHSLLQLHSI